jgi:ankyrin repeat protein
MEVLLRAGSDVNIFTYYGETSPLHVASEGGHLGIVEALLRWGADVDRATPPDGYMPLHQAALSGHSSIVHSLPLALADMNGAAADHSTPRGRKVIARLPFKLFDKK